MGPVFVLYSKDGGWSQPPLPLPWWSWLWDVRLYGERDGGQIEKACKNSFL